MLRRKVSGIAFMVLMRTARVMVRMARSLVVAHPLMRYE